MTHYDYFVIGGGSGGVRSARIAAGHGAKVALAEKSDLGGTCVNLGCIPKKLFSYAADYGASLEDMKGFGWENIQADFNWKTLVENKNTEIVRLNTIYQSVLANAGVTIINGHAQLLDEHTIQINDQTITADNILIAVGGKPRQPHFAGAEYCGVSDDAFHLDHFPRRVVIQGGGYISVEFAHIFKGLGAKVTLLYRGDTWLHEFDHEMVFFLKEEYLKQGIDVRFQSDIKLVTNERNAYQVHLNDDKIVECDFVLSAIGRVPNTENLGLDAAGIETLPNGQIKVNENWQTSKDHIYAVGDVSNNAPLTPYAIAEGHILADRLYSKGRVRDINLDLVPTAVFSGPPMGTIGISEEEAKEKHLDYKVYRTDFRPLRHTLTSNSERTFMKLIVQKDNDKVIGCHMVGTDTPEILQGIAICMNMGATKADFDRTIGIHPTSAEELVTLKE